MKFLSVLSLLATLVLSGCETMSLSKHYDQSAYKPKNPNNVVVKASLDNKMVYIMEGNKPLLVTATAIGRPETPTPRGNFRVFNKIADKRSNSYGYWIRGEEIVAAKRSNRPSGSVWPSPRTHGCLRLHKNDAADFYALVKNGTPVNIARTQPKDSTLGANFNGIKKAEIIQG